MTGGKGRLSISDPASADVVFKMAEAVAEAKASVDEAGNDEVATAVEFSLLISAASSEEVVAADGLEVAAASSSVGEADVEAAAALVGAAELEAGGAASRRAT